MAEATADGEAKDQILWEQGDFALGVGGLLYADIPRSQQESETLAAEGLKFATEIDDSKVIGLAIVSQTCDIVNGHGPITVCPLIECDDAELVEIRRGTRPSYATIENTPAANVYADLSRMMSVSRDLFLTWTRNVGFNGQATRTRFAEAIERKFGRFAFPDDIVVALKKLRSRILERHDSQQSDIGKVYRSLMEVRVRVAPDWYGPNRNVSLIVMVREAGNREASMQAIQDELNEQCRKIKWPDGIKWDPNAPMCTIGAPEDLTAKQIIESKALDLHYLS